MASLNTVQITVLNWFYTCYEKNQPASFNGSIQHFGEVLKIREPMDVIMSLMDMGMISINKNKLEASITKSGIQYYENLRKNRK
jgi:hypothetical protein